MIKKYCIGLDYGTQSGRAVLIEVNSGTEIYSSVLNYKDLVIDEYLPNTNIKLEDDWALQNPDNYIEVLTTTIPDVLENTGVKPEDIIGIGIDFTACTMVATDKNGKALCQLDKYKNIPHAWVKLWKHHAAQPEANKINEIAERMNETFLARYGGKISSEWMLPKIWQVLDEAPEIYDITNKFMEAGDWLIMQMTGIEARNSCMAGYKAIYHKKDGYPSKDFLKALDPRLETLVEDKLSTNIFPNGSKAGELTKEMAKQIGLCAGTAVAVANVDAHVSLPAVGITDAGKMLMIMGTSTCHIVMGENEKICDGMCGVVEDGVIEGYYGYEAGQSAVGDIFEWFTTYCVPASYMNEADDRDINIHTLLEEKASKLKPGESGLIALDWFNGNRSILVDTALTGMFLGANLLTKPEEMYRALIEATAFGTNIIINSFTNNGVPVDELFACGGLSQKTRCMQIYADVTNREIKISDAPQTPALGSAMFAALAAGKAKGGYDSIVDAANVMSKVKEETYKPIPENVLIYKKLFTEYEILHDYFGKGENDVMKRLRKIKAEVKG